MMIRSTFWLLVGILSAGVAQADVGAVGAPTLCRVTGVVRAVMQEEMASAASPSTHVMVPVIALEVASATSADPNYSGDFCTRISATGSDGKGMGYYRLCDPLADFMTAQTISGIVGLSQGGGRLCLAQISVQK